MKIRIETQIKDNEQEHKINNKEMHSAVSTRIIK